MPSARIVLLACFALVLASGCRGLTPEETFFRSTQAFADGEVDEGISYFSERLRRARLPQDLEYYYSVEDNRRGVAFLLEDAQFQVLSETDSHVHARVIWTTGRIENVHLVKESGQWRLDIAQPRGSSLPRQ